MFRTAFGRLEDYMLKGLCYSVIVHLENAPAMAAISFAPCAFFAMEIISAAFEFIPKAVFEVMLFTLPVFDIICPLYLLSSVIALCFDYA